METLLIYLIQIGMCCVEVIVPKTQIIALVMCFGERALTRIYINHLKMYFLVKYDVLNIYITVVNMNNQLIS